VAVLESGLVNRRLRLAAEESWMPSVDRLCSSARRAALTVGLFKPAAAAAWPSRLVVVGCRQSRLMPAGPTDRQTDRLTSDQSSWRRSLAFRSVAPVPGLPRVR